VFLSCFSVKRSLDPEDRPRYDEWMGTHKIGVANSIRIKGIYHPREACYVPQMLLMPLAEALNKRWGTDAHFACYNTEGSRYRKIMASRGGIRTKYLAFDCDNRNHDRWKNKDDVLTWFDTAMEIVPNFYCIYTTRSGGRIILRLVQELDVRQAEVLHKKLTLDFQNSGLNVDAACSDWTRFFRLPYVTRDGAPSWESEHIDVCLQEKSYRPEFVPDMPESEEIISRLKTYTIPQPGPEAKDLVWRME